MSILRPDRRNGERTLQEVSPVLLAVPEMAEAIADYLPAGFEDLATMVSWRQVIAPPEFWATLHDAVMFSFRWHAPEVRSFTLDFHKEDGDLAPGFVIGYPGACIAGVAEFDTNGFFTSFTEAEEHLEQEFGEWIVERQSITPGRPLLGRSDRTD